MDIGWQMQSVGASNLGFVNSVQDFCEVSHSPRSVFYSVK